MTFDVDQGGTAVGSPVTAGVSDGKASATFDLPGGSPAGAYTVQAHYSDSGGEYSASSGSTQLAVGAAGTTTVAQDATVTFTVTVGTRSVTATGSVSAGAASAKLTLPAGTAAATYPISATYSDSAGNYDGSADATHTLTVAPAAQTIDLTSPGPGTVGSDATLTATGGASGAAVVFSVGPATSPSGACTVSGDTVAYALAGTCVIDANQAGTADYTAAPTVSTSITVGPATPGVTLSASPSSGATVATPVTLQAAVVPVAGGPAPAGTVSFTVAGDPGADCSDVPLDAAGSATCDVGDLPAGSYSMTATYSGDANYTAGPAADVTGYTVDKLATSVTVTPSVSTPVFGQPDRYTASVTSGGQPVTGGTVQWEVDGADVGSPVTLAGGTAVSAPSTLPVGSHTVTAAYSGTATDAGGSGQVTTVVAQAATATKVSVHRRILEATVRVVAPGAGRPTGTVTFTVGGKSVGTARLAASGTATLRYRSTGAHDVSAAYAGSASFLPSAGSTATRNPTIKAHVSSAHAKTRYGWYRSPVTVRFTCKAGSAPLAGKCPKPVVVSPINIDTTAPRLRVTGATSGATYDAPGPSKLACQASDALAGLAHPCTLTVTKTATGVTYRATATDRAGNTATVTGHYALLDYFVAGAPRVDGRFQVVVGRTYTVEAYVPGRHAPMYLYAAPAGVAPGPHGAPMTSIGGGLWAIRTTITRLMTHYTDWTLGVKVGTTVHDVGVALQR